MGFVLYTTLPKKAVSLTKILICANEIKVLNLTVVR